jgi:hypothetical protein
MGFGGNNHLCSIDQPHFSGESMSVGGPVLGLDPSSTVIGYGALTLDLRLVDAGSIRPTCASDGSFERIVSMSVDLETLFGQIEPSVILVEWTKGKVGQRHKGLGAGLAVYGCGVGAAGMAAWRWSRDHPGCQVHAILENDWTGGVPKRDRQLAIAGAYPEYAAWLAQDVGGDISDGIGIADWWIQEQRARQGLFER